MWYNRSQWTFNVCSLQEKDEIPHSFNLYLAKHHSWSFNFTEACNDSNVDLPRRMWSRKMALWKCVSLCVCVCLWERETGTLRWWAPPPWVLQRWLLWKHHLHTRWHLNWHLFKMLPPAALVCQRRCVSQMCALRLQSGCMSVWLRLVVSEFWVEVDRWWSPMWLKHFYEMDKMVFDSWRVVLIEKRVCLGVFLKKHCCLFLFAVVYGRWWRSCW